MNIIFPVIAIASVIVLIVTGLISLWQAATKKNLHEPRWLWILLILFFGPISIPIFFFVEDNKRLGIFYLAAFATMVFAAVGSMIWMIQLGP